MRFSPPVPTTGAWYDAAKLNPFPLEWIEPTVGMFVEIEFCHDSVFEVQNLIIVAPTGCELKMLA